MGDGGRGVAVAGGRDGLEGICAAAAAATATSTSRDLMDSEEEPPPADGAEHHGWGAMPIVRGWDWEERVDFIFY
jgi:hypothetical protein